MKAILIFDAICLGIVAIRGIIRDIKFVKYYNMLLKLFHYIELHLLFNYDGYYQNITVNSLGLIFIDRKDNNTAKTIITPFFIGAYYKTIKPGEPSLLQKIYIFDTEHKDKVFNNDIVIPEDMAKENALLCIQLNEKDNSIGIYTSKVLNYTSDVLLSMKRYSIIKNTIKIFFGPLKHKKDFVCPVVLRYDAYNNVVGMDHDE